MTDTATVVSSSPRVGDLAPTSSREGRWRRPPGWLWPLTLVGQVAIAMWLTSYMYFVVDDFMFLQQARTEPFGWLYLREPLFEHFSPITRLLNTILVHVAPGDFAVAHGIQLALYALAVAAFALTARTILGNSWTALALTCIFGQSLFLMRVLMWWTATANILPATGLGLLAFSGYLRWRKSGSSAWLAVSIVAFALALLDYETAILFPVYLGVVRLLVLEDRLDPRAWWAALWRERAAWLSYAALDALALINYLTGYYSPVAHPPAIDLARFLKIALIETFVPALMGISNARLPSDAHPVYVAAQTPVVGAAWLLAIVAVAITLYLRPRVWRCLAAFIVIFLMTVTPVGLNRISMFGLSVGAELYYQQSAQYMFLVLTALALSPEWGGRRAPEGTRDRRLTRRRFPTTLLAAGGAAAVAAYGTLFVMSVEAVAAGAHEPRWAHSYVATFQGSVERVRATTHREPVLLDLRVPVRIMPPAFGLYDRYSQFFPITHPGLRIDEIADPAYALDDSGLLVPVRFSESAQGVLRSASVSATDGSGTAAAPHPNGSTACVPSGRTLSRLHVPLSASQYVMARPGKLPYGIRVRYRMPHRAAVPVILVNATVLAPDLGVDHLWGAGDGGELAPLIMDQRVDELAFDLPPGSCVSDLSIGVFDFSGPPV
jgi:hypothetical protein